MRIFCSAKDSHIFPTKNNDVFAYVVSRDVIRSPDIRTFESRSEVRTQFQHPEVRIKYQNCSKMYNFIEKIFIITQRMTSSRTSDFADENTTIGDNCQRCVFV